MEIMTPRELKARLAQPGAKPIVVDVRQPWELNICALPDAIPIPMSTIPVRMNELDPNQEIVVMCHHGVRSMQVALFLERQGFQKLYNLHGGIDAWAREVDPGMAKY